MRRLAGNALAGGLAAAVGVAAIGPGCTATKPTEIIPGVLTQMQVPRDIDGIEIEVPLDRLDKGDIVAVHTGEMVPVDGIIVEGLAMIDQHALTGESMPAEKGVGDRVFASTVMVAGKVHVAVEKSGSETATARIAQILNDSAATSSPRSTRASSSPTKP